MKISVDSSKLLSAFQIASAVAPSRSPKAILRNVRMEAGSQGVCRLTATDLEIGVRVDVAGVEISEAGDVLLPADRLGAILRECRDSRLTISSDGRRIIVRGERSEFKLSSENPDEFPTVAEFTDEQFHSIKSGVLAEMIRRTLFAVDADSSRYALGGVCFEMGAGPTMIAVATDGRRLAKIEGPAESVNGHDNEGKTTIVPKRALSLIERALADIDDLVSVAVHNNEVLVRTLRMTVVSRLVEGRFPEWRDVFPRRADSQKIELPIGPLHSAVRQAAITTSEDSVGVDFTFEKGKIVMASYAADRGQSRVELPIAYDGPAIDITLDPSYFAEFMKVLDPEKTFSLDIRDGESSAVCSTDDGYQYVIMPLARDKR